jgi:hypothetical protein
MEVNSLAGIHLALAIERLMIAEFGIQDHRQQIWPARGHGRSDEMVQAVN